MKKFHIGLLAIVFVVSGNLFAAASFENIMNRAARLSGHMMAERVLLEGTKVLAEKVDHAALHSVPGLTKDQMVEMVNSLVYDLGKAVVTDKALSKEAAKDALLGLSAKVICHYIIFGAEKALHKVLTIAHVENTDPLKGYELQKFFVMNLLSQYVKDNIDSGLSSGLNSCARYTKDGTSSSGLNSCARYTKDGISSSSSSSSLSLVAEEVE